MSVGLLLINHGAIGEALLQCAIGILGECPLPTETLAVAPGDPPEVIADRARELLRRLQGASAVLILTDLLGSTPSNIAGTLQRPGEIHVVTGLNLPMLLKVLDHASLDLPHLTELALAGGRNGIQKGMAQGPLRPTGRAEEGTRKR